MNSSSMLSIKALIGLCLSCLAMGGLTSCTTTSPVVPSLNQQAGTSAKAGQAVWHDLVTPDPSKAQSFYSSLFGWQFDAPNSGYTVIRNDKGMIGGMVDSGKLGKRTKSSVWITSIAVADIESTVDKLRVSGGSVLTEPVMLPQRGHMATVADPQGAVVQLVEISEGAKKAPSSVWAWHDLVTSDPKAAAHWYSRIEGMSHRPLGSHGRFELRASGMGIATISKNPFQETRNTWIPVIPVDDLEQKLARTKSLGGRVVLTPSSKIGSGEISMILDPSGAPIILQAKKGGQP